MYRDRPVCAVAGLFVVVCLFAVPLFAAQARNSVPQTAAANEAEMKQHDLLLKVDAIHDVPVTGTDV